MTMVNRNQRKLKENSSFEGVKTKCDDASPWGCVLVFGACAPVCNVSCSLFVSVQSVSVFISALRWKTDFFGESLTALTCADVIAGEEKLLLTWV